LFLWLLSVQTVCCGLLKGLLWSMLWHGCCLHLGASVVGFETCLLCHHNSSATAQLSAIWLILGWSFQPKCFIGLIACESHKQEHHKKSNWGAFWSIWLVPQGNELLVSDNSLPPSAELRTTSLLKRSKCPLLFSTVIKIVNKAQHQCQKNWTECHTSQNLVCNFTEKRGINFDLWQKPSVWPIRVLKTWIILMTPVESRVKSSICQFGLRWTQNCVFPLVAKTSSASVCGKKFPVSIDILRSFCVVGISALDFSSHMLQVNHMQFPPASLSAEFWNLVLHLSVSSQEILLLNAAIPSSLHRPQHLFFPELWFGVVWDTGSHWICQSSWFTSTCGEPFFLRSASPSCSQHFSTQASGVDCIPNLIKSRQCSMAIWFFFWQFFGEATDCFSHWFQSCQCVEVFIMCWCCHGAVATDSLVLRWEAWILVFDKQCEPA